MCTYIIPYMHVYRHRLACIFKGVLVYINMCKYPLHCTGSAEALSRSGGACMQSCNCTQACASVLSSFGLLTKFHPMPSRMS